MALEVSRGSLGSIALRLVAAYLALSVAFHVAGSWYASALLPVMERGLKWAADDDLVVRSLYLESNKVKVVATVPARSEGGSLKPQQQASFWISAHTLYICPVLALSLLLAWPKRSTKQKVLSLGLVLPALALLTVVDTQAVLSSRLAQQLDPSALKSPSFWWFFLENGGRQLLALASALAAHRASVRMTAQGESRSVSAVAHAAKGL